MKNNYRFGTLLLLSIMIKSISGCPFIINNDTKAEIIIVDPYNKQALHIGPGSEAEIDPSISGWQYYFYHEKLDIYVPREDNRGTFYRRYQLVEKYCTVETTKLTLTDIAQFVDKPTDRFTTYEFKPPVIKPHEHDAHAH